MTSNCRSRNISLSTASIIWILCLLPHVEPAVRFTHHPPGVLYVQTGKTARFVWDYTVGDRNTQFGIHSPEWGFYDAQNTRSVIGFDNGLQGWKWTLSNQCPARLKNPTVRVSKESTATLVISSVTTADNGVYACTLVLSSASPMVSKVRLIVTVIPQFNPQLPLAKTITEGEELSITCTAIGPPTPNITWVKDQLTKSTGTGSATLRIPNIRRDQNGTYECQARNNPNERPVTAQTVVTIYYPPQSNVSQSNITVLQGDDIVIRCTADGNPPPSISWTKAVGVIKAAYTVAGGTLRIPDAIKTDAGKYICTANNTYDSKEHTDTATALVVVKYRPSIMLDMLKDQTVNQSESLTIKCDADGYPPPTIKWKTPTGSVHTGNVYSIRSVSRLHAGTYTCTASNGIGKEAVASIKVIVQFKPIIDESHSSLQISSWNGNSIRLRCFATGLPTPQISWYKPTNQQITTGVNIVPGGSEVTLLTTADQGDYGQYKCRATNILGSDEHVINVTQLLSPGRVIITIYEVEASSMNATWTKPADDGGSPVTGYLLEVGTKPPRITVNTHAVLTGLKANTPYTVKVYAQNAAGYGVVSFKVIRTKRKGKPAVPVLLSALLEATGSKLSVVLRWEEPDDNGADITRYTIYMKEVKRQAEWTKYDDVKIMNRLEYRITENIVNGRTYMFLVTAWNKYGESLKDKGDAKTVNTTTTKATPMSATKISDEEESKGNTIALAVIIALLVLSLCFNVLQFIFYLRRRAQTRSQHESQSSSSKTSSKKDAAGESYENDFELEDNTTSAVTATRVLQSVQKGSEYETIQSLQIANPNTAQPFKDTSDYQELNILPNTSWQRPVYEPLRTRPDESSKQHDVNEQKPYESLNIRNQNPTYQSLQDKDRESAI